MNLLLISLLPLFLLATPATPICRLPPDFWCDHPDVSLECTGGSRYCRAYKLNRKGRAVADLALAFETACPDSQQFDVHRLYPQVLSRPEYNALVHVKPVPWGLARRLPGICYLYSPTLY